MLFTILISIALVALVFVFANKYTKKKEQPTVPTVDEEPLGYETSSLAELGQLVADLYPGTPKGDLNLPEKDPNIAPIVDPEIVALASELQPKPKAKKKMSAKPKVKAPKKKKDA